MDHYPTLDRSAPLIATDGDPSKTKGPAATASVSARMAESNTHPPTPPEVARFPPEDAGRSLAELAQRDLDAALQLLAERAQYITGANGAAIALRRGHHHDMLCRASAGSTAPELGALLSMEYGLSGESVRTRQLLRCDDTERDPRVNHDVCRALGIASVVVMPIASGEQVFGVFELLSGRARAFNDRDLSALARLSQMVETAVNHAIAPQNLPAVTESAAAHRPSDSVPTEAELVSSQHFPTEPTTPEPSAIAGPGDPSLDLSPEPETLQPSALPKDIPSAQTLPPAKEKGSVSASRKAVFWSAAMRPAGTEAEESHLPTDVPPVLRHLRKCQACGFPVSQGRTLCVECEEKQWRGQRPTSTAAAPQNPAGLPDTSLSVKPQQEKLSDNPPPIPLASGPAGVSASFPSPDLPAHQPALDRNPFLSASLQTESWFAANKYVLGAILILALLLAVIALLH